MQQPMARIFFLSVATALGLTAFTAGIAQAEENLSTGGIAGSFLVKKEKALATLGVTFEATQVGTGTLLVPGRVDILCTNGKATGEFHNANDALLTATATGCTTWQPVTVLGNTHKTLVKCTVKEPIVATALVLPKTHAGQSYVLFEGGAGELFTTLFLEGPECPLTKENKIMGAFVAQIDNNDTAEPLLLFDHTIQKLFQTTATLGDHIKFGLFEAYVDADAKAKLTDAAHTGLTFGVC